MSDNINVDFCKECDDKHYWARKNGEALRTKDLCKKCRNATDKELKDDFTYTQIKKLNTEERVLEIAKMLSGENPKESALQNAKELLQN